MLRVEIQLIVQPGVLVLLANQMLGKFCRRQRVLDFLIGQRDLREVVLSPHAQFLINLLDLFAEFDDAALARDDFSLELVALLLYGRVGQDTNRLLQLPQSFALGS